MRVRIAEVACARIPFAIATILVVFPSVHTSALADGRFSVLVNPTVVFQSSYADDLLGDVGLGYDFGPKMDVPVDARVRLDVNAFLGSAQGSGNDVFGIGVSARSTKPLYFGGGLSIDFGSLNGVGIGPISDLTPGRPGASSIAPTTTNVELGVNVFAGQKLLSRPGFGLDLEESYRLFPSLGDNVNQSFGLGLRTSFL